MQCMILAAGEGKRMRPLTSHRPKVMLPLANRPMLDHLVCAARDAGILDFVFIVGYQEQEIRNYFGDGRERGITIRYVTQRHQRGTADAVRAARNHINGTFLLLNGDMIITTADIAGISSGNAPVMAIFQSDHPQDYGVVTLHENLVTGLWEKSVEPKSTLINAGMYLLHPDIFDRIEQVKCSSRGEYELTDALEGYIEEGTLRGYSLSSWLDAGYPWDLLDANARLLDSVTPSVEGCIEDGVTLVGQVAVGKDTTIRSGTYIEGPCVIGQRCRIGPHAYIRGATAVGDDCHIGHCTELKNCLIMQGTKIPHFNYLGDSIVGSGCNFGAGTKVANLRHDHCTVRMCGNDTRRVKMGAIIGDDVQFGINCSVNAGTVIGSRVTVAPHSFVEGCISDDTRIR